ncbi:MAG: T9SS type A sorting domain-containing protein [Candidatus Cloacimonetes bacterium]|nr:T9SS type A sorting domain-containing protein [Candidatus Cloacimonadota bacterium]
MKQLRLILLFIAINLIVISSLSAILTPDSQEYDAWKLEQIKPTAALDNAKFIVSPLGKPSAPQKDCPLLIPLDNTFTLAMSPNDDGYTAKLTLPFVFPLYGTDYTSCWVNNNGNVTFDYGLYSYTPWGFPSGNNPMLAPFFADVDTRNGGGAVWYKIESNRMIIIWDHVGYFSSQIDKLNTFELIFTDGTDPTIGMGNTVAFSYADMAWTTGSASGGQNGFYGSAATVGINKGDNVNYAQIGRFDHPGIDYDGPFNNNDGVDWLDCKVFYFDTGSSVQDATLIYYPSTYEDVLDEVDPPTGVDPEDPNTNVYYAGYNGTGIENLQYPVGEGIWYGWIYYNDVWHPADVSPITGPGTMVFSNVPFEGTFTNPDNVPFLLVKEDDTLPVELSSFTASQTAQNFVSLTWISQSENGLLGYRLYRNGLDSQQTAMLITPVMVGATNTSTTQVYNYIDPEVEPGNTYWYWLESVDYGSSNFYGPVRFVVEENTPEVNPEQTVMKSAYPNPFKAIDGTTIEVDVKDNDGGKVTIYNLIGQEIQSFSVTPGNNNINWDGKDSRGKNCSAGVYFYKLNTSSLNQTRKMLIIK